MLVFLAKTGYCRRISQSSVQQCNTPPEWPQPNRRRPSLSLKNRPNEIGGGGSWRLPYLSARFIGYLQSFEVDESVTLDVSPSGV